MHHILLHIICFAQLPPLLLHGIFPAVLRVQINSKVSIFFPAIKEEEEEEEITSYVFVFYCTEDCVGVGGGGGGDECASVRVVSARRGVHTGLRQDKWPSVCRQGKARLHLLTRCAAKEK